MAVLTAAVMDTISLTLKLLGKYQVSNLNALYSFSRTVESEALEKIAAERDSDYLIFGSSELKADGAIIFLLALYDRSAGRVTVKEKAETDDIFSVFEVADKLTIAFIRGFSNREVAFGSLTFLNHGESGSYQVYIDNEYIGENLGRLEKVLIGEHLVRLVQRRMNQDYLLEKLTVMIGRGANLQVPFEIPYLTDNELALFNSTDRYISDLWWNTDAGEEEITKALDQALAMASGINVDRACAVLTEKYQSWKVKSLAGINLQEVLSKERTTKNRRYPGNSELKVEGLLPEILCPLPPVSLGQKIEMSKFGNEWMTPPILPPVSLRQKIEIVQQNVAAGYPAAVSEGQIKLDGKANDWFIVPPIAEDEKNLSLGKGSDIQALYMAQDLENVYFMVKLYSTPNAKYNYQLQIYNIVDKTGRDIGATLCLVNRREGGWRGYIVEDWWESKAKPTLYKGASLAGVNEVVEMKIPLSTFGELGSVRVDFVIQELDTRGDVVDRVDNFTLRLH